MKLTIEIEKDYYELIKFSVEHGDYYRLYTIIANGKPYEEIINEDIRDAIKIGYNDGFEMAKAKYERPQGECEKCTYRIFTEKFSDSIAEVMTLYGITSIEELQARLQEEMRGKEE